MVLASDGGSYEMAEETRLVIKGADVKVGFDGDAGGTATLRMAPDTQLTFIAQDGALGMIQEFVSGYFDPMGQGVRSGVSLGGASLKIDLSEIAAPGESTFDLVNVDELIGDFGSIDLAGLADDRDADILVNYNTDKVVLMLGAEGQGTGTVTHKTRGEADNAQTADVALYNALISGVENVTDTLIF